MKLLVYCTLLLAGVIGSGETEVSGGERYSLVFDGENYVQLPHASEVTGDEPEGVSVSLWVKFHEFGESVYLIGGRHGRPYDLWVRGCGNRIDLRVRGYDIDFAHASGRVQPRGLDLEKGEWYHLCATYSYEEGEGVVYLDGEEIASEEDMTVVQPRNFPLRFGRAQRYASLKNQQADVRIYTRALDGGEVRALYAGEEAEEGLAGHWKLTEGEGGKAEDSSGNEHHGELGPEDNMPEWSGGRPDLEARD